MRDRIELIKQIAEKRQEIQDLQRQADKLMLQLQEAMAIKAVWADAFKGDRKVTIKINSMAMGMGRGVINKATLLAGDDHFALTYDEFILIKGHNYTAAEKVNMQNYWGKPLYARSKKGGDV